MSLLNLEVKPFAKEIIYKLFHRKLSEITRFRNAFKGESCYLFGDGVSIKWFDLKEFGDKLSIPCGFILWHNDFRSLCVELATFVEPWAFWSPAFKINLQRTFILANAYAQTIERYSNIEFYLHLSNFLEMRKYKNVNFVFNRFPDHTLSSKIDCFYGSMRGVIALAIYLGISKCYLVGFDYTHNPLRAHHWYENTRGVQKLNSNYNEIFFNIAREYIDITTITLSEEDTFLDSISYHGLTGKPLVYKDNDLLLSENYI